MQTAWLCLCFLFIQAFGLPQVYRQGGGVVPPSRHGPVPAYPQANEAEPVYPPNALATSLLEEGAVAGVNADQFPISLGSPSVPMFQPMVPGYVPTSEPFDNPTTLSQPINPLPSTPDCGVRPQTVVEIQRMRDSASKIAVMMQQETLIMNKRKTYVEQMTTYLNDRIRELNKVKRELAQETRWLDLSSNRIFELEEREKLIKLQDIQSCLNERTTVSGQERDNVGRTLTDITAQQATVQASIDRIRARMTEINSATGGGGAATTNAAGGAGGNPAAGGGGATE